MCIYICIYICMQWNRLNLAILLIYLGMFLACSPDIQQTFVEMICLAQPRWASTPLFHWTLVTSRFKHWWPHTGSPSQWPALSVVKCCSVFERNCGWYAGEDGGYLDNPQSNTLVIFPSTKIMVLIYSYPVSRQNHLILLITFQYISISHVLQVLFLLNSVGLKSQVYSRWLSPSRHGKSPMCQS